MILGISAVADEVKYFVARRTKSVRKSQSRLSYIIQYEKCQA